MQSARQPSVSAASSRFRNNAYFSLQECDRSMPPVFMVLWQIHVRKSHNFYPDDGHNSHLDEYSGFGRRQKVFAMSQNYSPTVPAFTSKKMLSYFPLSHNVEYQSLHSRDFIYMYMYTITGKVTDVDGAISMCTCLYMYRVHVNVP